MATKQDRGTKRTCQNSECGSRFYDLNRTPIACPICGAAYVVGSSPAPITIVQWDTTPRKPKKKEFADAETNEDETAKEDTLDEVEADKTVGNDDDETFPVEEDEEGGDVSKILGDTKTEGGGES